MANRASARRYARALFDVVTKSGDVDAALVQLKALGAAFSGHPDLHRALTSPGVPLGVKQNIMSDVARAAAGVEAWSPACWRWSSRTTTSTSWRTSSRRSSSV